MEMVMQEVAKKHIRFSEDYRDTVYMDSEKYPTFGWGHLLEGGHKFVAVRDYAEWLFVKDYQRGYVDYLRIVKEFGLEHLSCPHRMVILDMCYNMGYKKMAKFVNTLRAFREKRFKDAAQGLKNSLWYNQTGTRAQRLINVVLTNEYPVIPSSTASGIPL
jgi:GH24 family phage-related lysozyme (muramidase)